MNVLAVQLSPPLPVEDGKTVRVHHRHCAAGGGGTSGTVRNSASWGLVGTFKRIGNTRKVGTAVPLSCEDDADWGIDTRS